MIAIFLIDIIRALYYLNNRIKKVYLKEIMSTFSFSFIWDVTGRKLTMFVNLYEPFLHSGARNQKQNKTYLHWNLGVSDHYVT